MMLFMSSREKRLLHPKLMTAEQAREILSQAYFQMLSNYLGLPQDKTLDHQIAVRDALAVLVGDYTASIDAVTN